MTLVDADTGEVLAGCTPERARELTDGIKGHLTTAWSMVIEAYQEQAWAALGHPSWDEYCEAEFGTGRLRLPREERFGTVKSLRDAGLSIRAIASVTGASKNTVNNDLKVSQSGTPAEDHMACDECGRWKPKCVCVDLASLNDQPESEPGLAPSPPASVTGTDGKTYAPTQPARKSTPRKPLPDAWQSTSAELTKCADRLVSLTQDSRYSDHKEELTRRYASDLLRSIAAASAAVARLDPAGFPDGEEARQWCLTSLQATTETLQRLAASIGANPA